MFDPHLARWRLTADGDPIITHSGRLLPVRLEGAPAMLKLAADTEERFGAALMEYWGGEGAARVLARDGEALLMERAEGPSRLDEMARTGRDDEASRILCAVATRLHAPRPNPPPELVPLTDWFRELWPAADARGGILARSAAAAGELLAEPREVVVLHGDLHHGNVLDFGPRGWLAIDPKRLRGERAFDYANIFTNPDLDDPSRPVATTPGRFARRLEVVCEAAGLERERLLRWILAWTGLSAVWYLGDGDPAHVDLTIAELAAAELGR
ncbi:aminoglycoside phosphotransferase family protein [Aquabacter sp. CN5-332]|uniref:aminoglycoside phosphotransferase family protein n=1 Tax=Aquabacter sp. CN5-332 TaxID=3156608 RepID=UPI0032B6019F